MNTKVQKAINRAVAVGVLALFAVITLLVMTANVWWAKIGGWRW